MVSADSGQGEHPSELEDDDRLETRAFGPKRQGESDRGTLDVAVIHEELRRPGESRGLLVQPVLRALPPISEVAHDPAGHTRKRSCSKLLGRFRAEVGFRFSGRPWLRTSVLYI
jgi:hypothetical protein